MMIDEQELLAAQRHWDAHVSDLLFENDTEKIYRLSIGLLDSESEAEGIEEETLLYSKERFYQFEGGTKESLWLDRVS